MEYRQRTQVQEIPMRKAYAAPVLVAKGEVVEATQYGPVGVHDPFIPLTGMGSAPGNVGYQL
jgi:hypothetical protein